MMESHCFGSVLLTEHLSALYGTYGVRSRNREHILTVVYEMDKDKLHHSGLTKKGLLVLRHQ